MRLALTHCRERCRVLFVSVCELREKDSETMAKSPARSPDVNDVEAQIAAIRDDVSELTRLLKDLAATKAEAATDALKGEAESLKRQAHEAADEAVRQAKSAATSIEDHIVQKPVQSALIALLIGILIGAFGRR